MDPRNQDRRQGHSVRPKSKTARHPSRSPADLLPPCKGCDPTSIVKVPHPSRSIIQRMGVEKRSPEEDLLLSREKCNGLRRSSLAPRSFTIQHGGPRARPEQGAPANFRSTRISSDRISESRKKDQQLLHSKRSNLPQIQGAGIEMPT